MFQHEYLQFILFICNCPILCVHGLPQNITLNIWHWQLLDTFLTDEIMHNSCINNEAIKNNKLIDRCCDCDDYCRFKGSCCIDAFFERYPMRPDLYMNIFLEITKVGRSLRCKPIMEGADVKRHNVKDIVVKEKCPKSFNSNSSLEMCLDTIQRDEKLWLLLGEDDIIYNGSNCAECNNQSNAKPIAIKAKGCNLIDESKSVTDLNKLGLQDFKDCYIHIIAPNYTNYECRGEVKRAQHAASRYCSEYEYKLCLSYNARINYNYIYTFANPHCLKCFHGTSNYESLSCHDVSFTPPPGYTVTIQMFDHKEKTEVTSFCQAGYK